MKSIRSSLAALALMATPASAMQEPEPPETSVDQKLMEIAADSVVPFRYITVVPDFVMSVTLEQKNNLQTLEVEPPQNQVQLRTIHLSAIFMDRQSGKYMSTDCEGIDKISQEILVGSVKEKDETAKLIYQAQLRQFQKAGEELQCPARPFV